MAQLRVVKGMGIVANYECLDMHGYIVEDTISYSPDKLAFWPRISEWGFELGDKIGLFGAFIVRKIFELPGVKGLWIDPHEVIIHRETHTQWEELEDDIISTIINSYFLFECMVREMLEEIMEEHALYPLDECQLEILEKYYRDC